MSVSQNINIAYSLNQPLSAIFPSPIISLRSPLTTDKAQLGTLWVNKTLNAAWVLTSIVSNSATWSDISGGAGSFSTLTVTGNANIGTAANATVNIGNDLGTTSVSLNSGSGEIILATNTGGEISLSSDEVHLTATNSIVLDTTPLIDIGTSALAATVNIGNVTGATQVNVNTGTGGMFIATTNGIFDVTTGTAALELGTDPFAKTITIGNVTGATAVDINGGTGGINLVSGGIISMAPTASTIASPTASVTSNVRVIKATFTGFTTASAGSQAFTIVSSAITVTSGIFATVTNLNASTNGALMSITGITQSSGQIIVSTKNNGGGALGAGDNVLVNIWVIS